MTPKQRYTADSLTGMFNEVSAVYTETSITPLGNDVIKLTVRIPDKDFYVFYINPLGHVIELI